MLESSVIKVSKAGVRRHHSYLNGLLALIAKFHHRVSQTDDINQSLIKMATMLF